MKNNRLTFREIAEKLGRRANAFSEEMKSRVPFYLEHLKSLARLGRNISLDTDKGVIKIKEGFVNDYLKEVFMGDKGLQSIRVSCIEGKASFLIELKKFLVEGQIEIPFTVKNFTFNKDKRTVTFEFGRSRIDNINNYYSKIIFWFSLSVISVFYKKEEKIKNGFFHQDSFTINTDGTYTIDLNKIPELRELFEKDMANIRYWDLISVNKLSFEKGLITLSLSRKPATIIRKSIVIVEALPAGRLIRPLLNRF